MEHDIAVKSLAAERYLLGEMQPDERESFEAHYFECEECALEVRSASAFEDAVKEALAPPPVREVLPEKQTSGWFAWLRPAFASPVFATLLLAGMGLETGALVRTARQLNEVSSPRIVASAVLRGETRGEAAKVAAAPGQPLLLTFDFMPLQKSPQYRFEVQSASGARVIEFTQAVSPTEETLNLSIPKPDLTPGRYNLVVFGAGAAAAQSDQPVGRYSFEIESSPNQAR